MFYVYILLLTTRKLYTGSSRDLRKRYQAHLSGKVASTRNKVVKLVHYEAYLLKSDAVRREKFLKTTEGKRLLKQQIRDVLKLEEVI